MSSRDEKLSRIADELLRGFVAQTNRVDIAGVGLDLEERTLVGMAAASAFMGYMLHHLALSPVNCEGAADVMGRNIENALARQFRELSGRDETQASQVAEQSCAILRSLAERYRDLQPVCAMRCNGACA